MTPTMIREGMFDPDEFEEEEITHQNNKEYQKDDWLWLENQKV